MLIVNNLHKSFKKKDILQDINFSLEEGEVLGFIGPNGAGKTTTMRILTGFLNPSSGNVSIMGYDVETQKEQAQRDIGYLPEGAPLYGEMTVKQFLLFIANIRNLYGIDATNALNNVLSQFNLIEVQNQIIETLSKGYKRRVAFAQAMLHNPKILILDEPTDGLDPNQKYEVHSLIKSLSKDKIIIISTHILEEVKSLCSRVIIINNGTLIADESPSILKKRSRYYNCLKVTLAYLSVDTQMLNQLSQNIPKNIELEISYDNSLLFISKSKDSIYKDVEEFLISKNLKAEKVTSEDVKLDEVFRQLTYSK